MRENGIKPATYNSIINKTPISYKANRMIGGKAPSNYVDTIQSHKQVGLTDIEMDEILRSHSIEPKSLRSDDFYSFYESRGKMLLNIVSKAMKKEMLFDQANEYNDIESEEIAES